MIQHNQGRANKVVDALSRKNHLLTTLRTEIVSLESLRDKCDDDIDFGDIWRRCKSNEKVVDDLIHDGCLFKGNQLCISKTFLRDKLIFYLCADGLAAHPGRDRSIELLVERFF